MMSSAMPVSRLTRSMDRLQGGDLDAEISGAARKDEIGQLNGVLVDMCGKVQENIAHAQEATAQAAGEAARAREAKVKELSAKGEAALAVVQNISDAAYDGGVRHIMDALAGGR